MMIIQELHVGENSENSGVIAKLRPNVMHGNYKQYLAFLLSRTKHKEINL